VSRTVPLSGGGLLDERRFREWLDLLAEDIEYTLDTNTLAQFRDRRKGWAPPTTYIFHEDKYQLERRVARIETGQAWADEPASRTRHFVTNVRILAQADDGVAGGLQLPCAHRRSRAITTATSAPAATRCAACTPEADTFPSRAGGSNSTSSR
jgi:hypothetical protein